MHKFSLRLTDEQHAELVRAASMSERSVQREIIYRLFGVPLDEQLAGLAAMREAADRHFKPDPKPERKK
jgi:hypothetical protein